MSWTIPRPRFGLRTLLVVVLVSAIAIAWWTSFGRWRTYRNLQARQRIDPYELKIAGDGSSYNVPSELVAILGDSRLRHWAAVRDVEILPGDLLGSLGNDRILRIWDLQTLHQKTAYECSRMLVLRDRQRAFLVRTDGTIELWDLPANRRLSTVVKLEALGSVDLACNADGSRLAIQNDLSGGIRRLLVVEVENQNTLLNLELAEHWSDALALDRDGTRLAWTNGRGEIVIADAESGAAQKTLGPVLDEQGQRYGINQIEFSADGKSLICIALSKLLSFDIESGQPEVAIEHDRGSLQRFWISESGNELAVLDGWLHVHQGSDGKWGRGNPRPLGMVGAQDVSRKGMLIAAAYHNHTISLWNRRRSSQPWRMPGGGTRPDVSALDFGPRGKWLVTGSRTGELSIWDTATWTLTRTWQGHADEVKHIHVSHDGSQFVTSGEDGDVVVWNTESATEVATLHDFQMGFPVSLSSDCQRLATYARGPTYGGIWDLPQGVELPVKSIAFGQLSDARFSPQSNLLVGRDKALDLVFVDNQSLKVVSRVTPTAAPLTPLLWFPDGKRVLVLEGKDTVVVYDSAGKRAASSLRLGTNLAKSFTLYPQGDWLAFSGYGIPVQIWHLPTGVLVKSWQIGPSTGVVSQVAFSPDGHYLATVNGNGTAYVLNLDGVIP